MPLVKSYTDCIGKWYVAESTNLYKIQIILPNQPYRQIWHYHKRQQSTKPHTNICV